MIILDSKAQLTVDVIAKVAQGKVSIVNVAKLLNKSHRTIERYLKRYQKVGIQFVIHRNTGRTPVNKIPNSLRRHVQSLIKEKYYDVNLQHLAELLDTNENIQIKGETLRHWTHDLHDVKRTKRRRSKVRKRRERMKSEGLLLQMDGSPHRWFGNKFYLIELPLRYSIAKQKIEIRKQPGGSFTAYFAGRNLVISEVVEPTKPSMYDLEI